MGILPSNLQMAKIGTSNIKIKKIAVSLLGNTIYTTKAIMIQAAVNAKARTLFLALYFLISPVID